MQDGDRTGVSEGASVGLDGLKLENCTFEQSRDGVRFVSTTMTTNYTADTSAVIQAEAWRVNPHTPSVIITPHGRISVDWSDQRAGEAVNYDLAEQTAAAIVEAMNHRLSHTDQPVGWKLVPVEPTEAMLDAAAETDLIDGRKFTALMQATWSAMLSAAPASPAVGGDVEEGVPFADDAWREYEADFDGLTDAEIVEVTEESRREIEEHESWCEAVASWERAGKPRAPLGANK